jgi:hypothetical protein
LGVDSRTRAPQSLRISIQSLSPRPEPPLAHQPKSRLRAKAVKMSTTPIRQPGSVLPHGESLP